MPLETVHDVMLAAGNAAFDAALKGEPDAG